MSGFFQGIKIFGAYTRSLPKKSLACMFRDSYGTGELNYPVFGENSLDTYEALILRSAGQDAFQARMRDVLVTSLLGEATVIFWPVTSLSKVPLKLATS